MINSNPYRLRQTRDRHLQQWVCIIAQAGIPGERQSR